MDPGFLRALAASLALVPLLSVAACGPGPALETYPERVVDRPLQLPDDVHSWIWGVGYFEERGAGPPDSGVSVPLVGVWEWGLSPRVSVVGVPLPILVNWRLSGGELPAWSLGLGITGAAFGDDEGPYVAPGLTLARKQKLGDDSAWVLRVGGVVPVAYEEGEGGMSVGALNAVQRQLGPRFAVEGGLAVSWLEEGARMAVFGGGPTDELLPGGSGLVMPLSALLSWVVGPRLDVVLAGSHSGVGWAGDYRVVSVDLGIVYRW